MNKIEKLVKLDGQDTVDGEALSPKQKKTERTMPVHEYGRNNMREWVKLREENVFDRNVNFSHTLDFLLGDQSEKIQKGLSAFGEVVPTKLDRAVTENDFRFNNPRIEPYNYIGDRVDRIVHHPDYAVAGDLIYGTGVVKKLATAGGLKEGMSYYFLSNHVGEAGHLCPVICNYETARVLKEVDDFPGREDYIEKLEYPNYRDNYTSSQFLTEVQGGSDVGANDTRAWQDDQGNWYIRGEKWFCSNADAELMVISARRSMERAGTKGLSMFLIPSTKPDGSRNDFTMRRLKEKLGTRALASAEIDYHDAYAIPLGENFNFMLEKVIHHSRIALAVAVLGFTSRAFQIAMDFSKTRSAFGSNILQYPLVRDNLARIKADMAASLAGTFALIDLQDKIDMKETASEADIAFCRLMVNIGKSVISRRTVDNVHHCVDAIGGNGAIENTSSMPRLLRDAIILENWEGTHNTLNMQVLRDIHKYQQDQHYLGVMRRMIGELPSDAGECGLSNAYLEQISTDLEALKGAEADLQTLLIKEITLKMANLFYYVSLVREGLDMQQRQGSDCKLKCAEMFHRQFMQASPPAADATYIELCEQILKTDMA